MFIEVTEGSGTVLVNTNSIIKAKPDRGGTTLRVRYGDSSHDMRISEEYSAIKFLLMIGQDKASSVVKIR